MRKWQRKSGLMKVLFGGAMVLMVSACATGPGVLPEERNYVHTPFDDYHAAFSAFENVEVSETTKGQLFHTGYDVTIFPNVEQLSYLDLIERFMPHDSITFSDLDPGLRACLEARLSCKGYQLRPSHIEQERVGSVMLDVLNFKRTEVTSGWQAQALFVLHDDVVVYKLWSGTQNVSATKQQTNPLGPFQNLGGAFSGAVRNAF